MQLITSSDNQFHDGDSSTGLQGTFLAAAWHNAVQGEIAAPIIAAGLTLDQSGGSNNSQLLAAILALIEANAGNYCFDTGTVNAYVIALNPAVKAYTNGLQVKFRTAHACAGPCTLNAGAGAVPFLRDDSQQLQPGDLPLGAIVNATYDTTSGGFLVNSVVASQFDAILQSGAPSFALDTGVANAYVGAYSPALTARAEGMVLRLKVNKTNTTACTFNDGLGTVPLTGLYAALQGGEMAAGGDAWLQWNSTVGANGSYVLLHCTGAPLQIAPGTAGNHAVQMAQIQNQSGTAFPAAGAAPTFTLMPAPAPQALIPNLRWRVAFGSAGALNGNTLNVAGFGAYPLKQYGPNGTLINAVITAGLLSDVEFNGSAMIVLDPIGAGRSSSGTTPVNATSSLLANIAGGMVTINAAVATTQTLPPAASIPAGLQFLLFNLGAGTATCPTSGAGPDSITVGGTAITSLTLGTGDSALLESNGNNGFTLIGGSVQLQYAAAFLSALNPTPQVRQTVAVAGVNPLTGLPNYINAGAGLTPQMTASPTAPVVINFAAGAKDYQATLTANQSFSASLANAINFLNATYINATSVTLGSTPAPPQYGFAYNQTAQALLHFDGASGSTAVLDDFGNSWAAQGGAKLQTTWSKFGTAALGGGGANSVLNGSTDYVKSTAIAALPPGDWTIQGLSDLTSLAATYNGVVGLTNAAGYGVGFLVNSSGQTEMALSSTGTSNDILSPTNSAVAVTAGTPFHWAICRDSVAGKYFLYIAGVMNQSISSTAKICPVSEFDIGSWNDAGNRYYTTGYIDEVSLLPYCAYPAGITFVPPAAAASLATPGYASDFISWANGWTVYQITGPSTVAGNNPAMTQVNRVYMGEDAAGATAISSVTPYALNGLYDSWLFAVSGSTTYNKNHNLGCPWDITVTMADDLAGTNERFATTWAVNGSTNVGWSAGAATRNAAAVFTGVNVGYTSVGLGAGVTTSNYRIIVMSTTVEI